MEEHGMHFGKTEFYQIIRNIGGAWNDSKERPIICLMKSLECDSLYWAIPVGIMSTGMKRQRKEFKDT